MMSLMLEFLRWTFSAKFVDDDDPRTPFHQWKMTDDDEDEDDILIQLLMPSIAFMIQVIWIVFLCIILGCILSTILYYGVIVPGRRDEDESSFQAQSAVSSEASIKSHCTATATTTTSQGLLVGFGVVIPLTLLIPFYAISDFDIRNVGFRLAWVSLPMTMILRTLEAVFGYTSRQHSQSLGSYVRHTGLVLRPKYDPTDGGNPQAATVSSVAQVLQEYLFWMSCLAVAYHCFASTNFSPFTTLAGTPFDGARYVYWDLPHLYDTFLQACVMNVTLTLSMTGASALGSLLTGVQMDDKVTLNPMFLSESVSDFWGRRWNNLIHVALKQGVYKPVRAATDSKSLASLAAFIVSGLCHEYVWMMLFFPTAAQLVEQMIDGDDGTNHCCRSCYCQSWVGKQLVFFGWNGVLIALEYFFGDTVAKHTKWLPRLLKSHLIVLLALPVGHLFTHDITQAGYFDQLKAAIPIIKNCKIVYCHMAI